MVWILAFFTVAGFNFGFWFLVGIVRFFSELVFSPFKKKVSPINKITPNDVAAIIPAHNEALTIKRTLTLLSKVLPKKNIYVANDASVDKTGSIARKMGINVYDIKSNVGKARALVLTLKKFNMFSRYKAILIHDADIEIDKNYMKFALPLFNDPKVAAVAPHQLTELKNYGFLETFFIAYRVRLWRVLQLGVRFGQTWKFTNVTYIIPGGLSVYRTKALEKIEIDAPGLIIEDFNMTFELHKKKLGRVAYNQKVIGRGHDPYYLKDYIKQVKRWNLGFWQTVKRNGIWRSLFWLSTGSYIVEMTLYALFTLATPVFIIAFYLNSWQPLDLPFTAVDFYIQELIVGVFFTDFFTTMLVAIFEKKWQMKIAMLFYGLGFYFLRYIDAFLYLYAIPLAFFTRSDGTWSSPRRKKMV